MNNNNYERIKLFIINIRIFFTKRAVKIICLSYGSNPEHHDQHIIFERLKYLYKFAVIAMILTKQSKQK